MLTAFALRNLKPRATPYKATDRDGMYAAISPKGTISFRYDYRINGRRDTLTIGRYGFGGISLAEDRERLRNHLFVVFNAEVVSDTHRANRRVRRLDGVQEGCPRIRTDVLVVQGGTGCVNVRVPAMPDRASFALHVEQVGHGVLFSYSSQEGRTRHTPAA